MLALAVFYFIYVLYCFITLLIDSLKEKAFDSADWIDACADLSLAAFLVLIGLAVEKVIASNWLLFSIPLVLMVGCRLYLRKLAKDKKKKEDT